MQREQLRERIVQRLHRYNIPHVIDGDNVDCTTEVSLWDLREIVGRQGIETVVAVIYKYNDVTRIHITEDGTTNYHKDNYIAGYSYYNGKYRINVSGPNYYAPSWVIEVMIKLGIHSGCIKWDFSDRCQIRECVHDVDTIRNLCHEYEVTEENGKIFISNK